MDPKYRNTGSVEVRLIEELAELIQAISKAQRFGWFNHHPNDDPHETNWLKAKKEMEDIVRIWEELEKIIEELKKIKYRGEQNGNSICND